MRHSVLLLIALCGAAVPSRSQTADELIAKNIQAKGGLDKIRALNSIRMTGKFDGGGGFVAAVSQDNLRPNLVRQEIKLQGMVGVEAYDGTAGWQIQPFGGHKDPELLGADETRSMLIYSDFDGPLVDYKAKGSSVEYLGHDIVDGDDALRLRVTLKNDDIIYYYLDPDTYLEIRREIEHHIRGSVRTTVEELGSYKPVGGVMFPFSVATTEKGSSDHQSVTVAKIEVNVPLSPEEFAVPASLKPGALPATTGKN
jgi:hypothetical protein